jgi:hypothetical protein
MGEPDIAAVRSLIDRQEIRDCLTRYCRGLDRLDHKLVMSAYHPGAVSHVWGITGTRRNLINWAFNRLQSRSISTQHDISTGNVELAGEVAHAETYFLSTARDREGLLWRCGGRYVDRLERRRGEWRIALRYAFTEWAGTLSDRPCSLMERSDRRALPASRRDTGDASYLRPLAISASGVLLGD